MLIDTHCHINMIVKKNFDVTLHATELTAAQTVIDAATDAGVTRIINVGTSLIESMNCVELARRYQSVYAAIGIHPNDCTSSWREELRTLAPLLDDERNKIVAIGECGLDMHYPDYDLQRQQDAFKAQIELALEHDRALIVHTRDARDETLRVLEEFVGEVTRGVIHCFSEDMSFAQQVIDWGYVIGIGGTLTYPKNNELRTIATTIPLASIILETDAPFLPPQTMRGQQNEPKNIKVIAQYLAELRGTTLQEVAATTTETANRLFGL